MKLKFYMPSDKELLVDIVRMAYSITTERKIVIMPPFNKKDAIFLINSNFVNNNGSTSDSILPEHYAKPLNNCRVQYSKSQDEKV